MDINEEKNKKEKEEKRVKLSTLVYSVLIILMFLMLVTVSLAYGTETKIGKEIREKISLNIPFPIAIIQNSEFVYSSELEKNLTSVQKYYSSENFYKEGLRIDFTTPDGKKRLEIKRKEIFDKLIEDAIIKMLAQERGIVVSESDIDKVVSQKLEEFGTEKIVEKDLLESYGWSLEDFKKQAVLPGAYKDALEIYISDKELDNGKQKSKITEAQKKLSEGKDFMEIVDKYSEGKSKENKGELGWVTRDQVAPEIQGALFDKKDYEKNGIIESSVGFHIIEIEDRKKEGSDDVLKLRQIFVMKNNFPVWLENKKKEMDVKIISKEFAWDKNSGSVNFKEEEMRKFEIEERSKSKGDASIMF